MPVSVLYDLSNTYAGSPPDQSRKTLRRLGPDSGMIHSYIKYDEKEMVEDKTPCLQNELAIIATLSGGSDYYDCIVTVTGTIYEHGSITGIPQVTGGTYWRYDDNVHQYHARGMMKASVPPVPSPKITPVTYMYKMRIHDRVPTFICETGTVGGMTITNPLNNGLVSLVVINIIQVKIHVLSGFMRVRVGQPDVLRDTATGDRNVTPTAVPGTETSTQVSYLLKPVEEGTAVAVLTQDGKDYFWPDNIPNDERSVRELMKKLRIAVPA